MKKTIEFVLPVRIEYTTEKDLREAIRQVRQNLHTEMISAGDTNFEYKSRKPRLLFVKGMLNL